MMNVEATKEGLDVKGVDFSDVYHAPSTPGPRPDSTVIEFMPRYQFFEICPVAAGY